MEAYGKYRQLNKLGVGTYGDVYKVQKIGSKEEYALKVISLTELDDKEKERIKREVDILRTLHHVNIVKMHESFYENNGKTLCIVMDFCEGGTLRQRIDRRRCGRPLPERECLNYLLQIAEGLKQHLNISAQFGFIISNVVCSRVNFVFQDSGAIEVSCDAMSDKCKYLHHNDIIHRDIKTRNILLTVEKVIKIGDFGTARYLDSMSANQMSQCVGTPYYMSPEMIGGGDYDEKTDIWSMGCCAYEMSTSKRVFENAETLRTLQAEIESYEVLNQLPEIKYSERVRQLIIRMLQQRVQSRPKASQVVTYIKDLLASTEHLCVLQQRAAQMESEYPQTKPLHEGNEHQQHESVNQDPKGSKLQLKEPKRQLQSDSGNETGESGFKDASDDDADDDSTLRSPEGDISMNKATGPSEARINPPYVDIPLEKLADEQYIRQIKNVASNTKDQNLTDDEFLAKLHALHCLPSYILDLYPDKIRTVRLYTLKPENEDQ